MAAKYDLLPNESVILQESSVAHGGIMAIYTDDLILTNLNVICVSKGMFGNTKGVYKYSLNQLKKYNGKPQAVMGKLSNGTATLDLFFTDGTKESFNFQTGNKRRIYRWIEEITKVICGDSDDVYVQRSNMIDPDSFAGAVVDATKQVREAGAEILGSLGFKPGFFKAATGSIQQGPEKTSKKCFSCSAPLVGYKGKTVKCKYCDTEQTL